MKSLEGILLEDAVVVLDVDDTLYLEQTYVRSGFESVSQHLADIRGVSGFADTLWINFLAGVRRDAFDRALTVHGLAPDKGLVKELVAVYRDHVPTISLLVDAENLLVQLRDRRAAVITDGPAQSQIHKIAALGLRRFVDFTVVTEELGEGYSKPHHRAFEMVEVEFGVAGQRCIYIGDNPLKDFIAPLQRGWQAVRVRRPASLHRAAPTPQGVMEVSTLSELSEQLKSLSTAGRRPAVLER